MESVFEADLPVVELLVEELEELQMLFPDHPCKKHFHYGKPRLYAFVINHEKGFKMSASQLNALIYLTAAASSFAVAALDQYGFPYTGASLANTTAVSDTPANVGATLGGFNSSGVAVLTLTQAGGEGSANVTISNGSVSLVQPVESYVPVLTSFTLTPAAPAATS